MDARSPRNTLLAAGVAFGAMAAVLVVVASSLSFSAILSVPAVGPLRNGATTSPGPTRLDNAPALQPG